jgi:DMSO/TMAO reductase YedYZ heme-binding membrane subunit
MVWRTLRFWFQGIRVYIAIGALLVSAETWWWAFASYGHTSLTAIRMEEVYAWLALGLLATALSIGPVYKVFPRLPGALLLRDARRLIGVSAAWFAALHAIIAYVSLFHATNPLNLPGAYRLAFGVGTLTLIILLLMAFTSFDAAFARMGVWWFRLHRLVYVAAIMATLHALLIGVHTAQAVPLLAMGVAAMLLLGLHIGAAFAKGRPTKWQWATMCGALLALALTFIYGVHGA